MQILVTGSAGHLGEALMRTLEVSEHEASGLDREPSPYTHHVGSIVDRNFPGVTHLRDFLTFRFSGVELPLGARTPANMVKWDLPPQTWVGGLELWMPIVR